MNAQWLLAVVRDRRASAVRRSRRFELAEGSVELVAEVSISGFRFRFID